MSIALKWAPVLMLWALASASAQDLDKMPPAERARAVAQNAALSARLEHGPKLPFEATPVKGWTRGMVSWIASDRSGLIYLLQRDLKTDPVVVLDQNGKILRSWGKGMFATPHAIRIDPAGDVWTTDCANSMVYKFSPDGRRLLEIEIGGLPTPRTAFCSTTDIAFAPNGHLYISDGYRNARILEYTSDGKKLREWGSAGAGPGQFKLPHSIQVDEHGIVYVADRENGRIQRFDLQGNYLGEWSEYGKTFGLKLDRGALWMSSIPRGPNGQPGWLIKVDRETGSLLGYINTLATHGMEVMANGDVLSATPTGEKPPQRYRNRITSQAADWAAKRVQD
jgi:DNA-binding beta-propeller fold protein YncE